MGAKGSYKMTGGSRTSVGEITNLGGGIGSNKSGTRFFRINAARGTTANRVSAASLSPRQRDRARQLRAANRPRRARAV